MVIAPRLRSGQGRNNKAGTMGHGSEKKAVGAVGGRIVLDANISREHSFPRLPFPSSQFAMENRLILQDCEAFWL